MNVITGSVKQTGMKDAKAMLEAVVGAITSGSYRWRGKYDPSGTLYSANDVVIVKVDDKYRLMYAIGVTSGAFDISRWSEVVVTGTSTNGVVVHVQDLTIPTTGWVADDIDDNGYEYYLDLANDKVTASAVPFITIIPEFLEIAENCGFNSSCQSFDGYLRFYANEVPASNMTVNLAMLKTVVDSLEITIPATGWMADDIDNNGYTHYIDILNENIAETQSPILSIHPEYVDVARESNFVPTCSTYNGFLRIYSNSVPKTDMSATLSLFNAAPNVLELEIPTHGWIADDIEGNGYQYYRDITNARISATQTPMLTIHPESVAASGNCKLVSTCTAFNGYIRLYSDGIPGEIIYATLSLFDNGESSGGGGGGGSAYVLPIASPTTLGGIKLGAGLTASADGTVRVDVDDKVIEEELKDTTASDGEADEAIDDAMSGRVTNSQVNEQMNGSNSTNANVGDSEVASDSEVDDMLDGIFGNN